VDRKENESAASVTLGIFIAEDANRGKNIGSTTVQTAIGEARKLMTFSQAELHVRTDNVRAIRCYQKCGFAETSRYVKNHLNENVEVIVLSCTV